MTAPGRPLKLSYNKVMNVGVEPSTVVQPGHVLYLTNGWIRLCHFAVEGSDYRIFTEQVNPVFPVYQITEVGPGWDALIGWTAEHHPGRVRVGLDPDARCPFVASAQLTKEWP